MVVFKNKIYKCSLDFTVDLIGGKWKVSILWRLKDGTKRFNELKRLIPRITHKMLTQQLRELEDDGLIERNVYAEVPPKVEYTLTNWGQRLIPIMHNLIEWGNDYLKDNGGGHIAK